MRFAPTAPLTRSSRTQTRSPSEDFVDDASDSTDAPDGELGLLATQIDILGDDLFPRESLVRHPASDLELITLTRAGDATAFGELASRHRSAALSFAQSVTNQFDAEDMVQEAFTRLFDTISQGGGPRLSFRAYLITTIRNVASAWGRSCKESASEFVELHLEERTPDEDPQALHAEQSLLRRALGSLPQRWRDVLWMSEVECRPVSEIAELLEMTPGAASQLSFRAREGLREAYIQAHLNRNAVSSSECEWFHKHAGVFVRETASPQVAKRAQTHLKICAPCCASLDEARTVSTRLVLLLPPLGATLAKSATGTSLLAVGTAGTASTAGATG
ncbi:sigma-70 family RNA polymerase sigma factor, partial [Timonella senegalensis]|uniref:RNA polymerase sigma factor n=1 Tax=Timonella senegalensis TaxID=1465825 RepID=UPI002FE3CA04